MRGIDLEFLGHEYRKCFILVQDNSSLLLFNSKKMHYAYNLILNNKNYNYSLLGQDAL